MKKFKTTIWMPIRLHREFKKDAERHHRTFTAHLIEIVKAHLEAQAAQ